MTASLYSFLALLCLCPVAFAKLARRPSDVARRVASIVGLLPIAGLAVLGAVWPSMHTLHALLILPAGAFLIASFVRPRLLTRTPWRSYVLVAQGLAVVSSGLQAWWLYR